MSTINPKDMYREHLKRAEECSERARHESRGRAGDAAKSEEMDHRWRAVEVMADAIGGRGVKGGPPRGDYCRWSGIKRDRYTGSQWFQVEQRANARGHAFDHPVVITRQGQRTSVLAVLSAPYRMPALDIFPEVSGLHLQASWYGYGSHGILWIRNDEADLMRSQLPGIV